MKETLKDKSVREQMNDASIKVGYRPEHCTCTTSDRIRDDTLCFVLLEPYRLMRFCRERLRRAPTMEIQALHVQFASVDQSLRGESTEFKTLFM
jgi:hypothetical protein